MDRICDRQTLKAWLTAEKKGLHVKGGGLRIVLRRLAGFEPEVLWHYQKRLRKTEYYLNTGKKIPYAVSRALLNRLSNKYAIHIFPNVFGKGLHIMHVGPIPTNANARAGENCSVHMNTAIVAHGHTADAPRLGSDIVIGVGATVLGGVEIADGIAIGAGAVVNKSFTEPGIAIAGVPARKISDNGRAAWNKEHKNT